MPTLEDVRQAVAAVLPEGSTFDDASDLVSAGIDSLKLMRLVNGWRRKGIRVSFAQCISEPSIQAWMKLFTKSRACGAQAPYARAGISAEASGTAPGKMEKFPLSDIQKAYFAGRQDGRTLGGVGCHAYLEIRKEEALDPVRWQQAWSAVLSAHRMLRCSFSDDGFQRIENRSPAEKAAVEDLRKLGGEEAAARLQELRAGLSSRRMDVEQGEVVSCTLCLLPDGSSLLLLEFDMLAVDVGSLDIVLRDLAGAYRGEPVSGGDFFAWSAGEGRYSEEEEKQDKAYWEERIPDLPGAPELPLAKRPDEIRRMKTCRRTCHVPADVWNRLKMGARLSGSTMVNVLLCAYAEVLARRSGSGHFLINLPLSNRRGAEGIVGEFTSVEVLDVNLDANQKFSAHLQAIGRQLYQDMDHRSWTGVQVLRELSKSGRSAPVVFAGNIDTALVSPQDQKTIGRVEWMISQTPQVWLDFQLYSDGEGGQMLVWDAVEELFPEGLLDGMFADLGAMVEHLAALVPDDVNGNNSFWSVDPVKLMKPVLRDSQPAPAVIADSERETGMHHAFFRTAAAEPQRPALIDSASGRVLTYGDLARRALGIAGALQKAGAERGELVAVTVPRSPLQIAAILGVLAAGCAYAPVSIDQPYIRRCKIHRGAGIRFAVSDSARREGLEWPEGCTVLDGGSACAGGALDAPVPGRAEDLAYVIFTSGSTGEPKGVEISHGGALNTIQSVNRLLNVGPESRALAVSSVDFDLSVYDIFGLLTAGGSLVLLSEGTRRNASVWAGLVEKYRVTVWNSVPMLADMLVTAAALDGRSLASVRTFMLSGDWIPLTLPGRLHEAAPDSAIAAMGGATEASIWSNIYMVDAPLPAKWRSVPYGRALPGQCWRVVDALGRDCPDWTPGELLIGGRGVALGYRADPVRTQASFVEQDGERWYHTGDMGRFWSDGTMEFLGRIDFQVKLHGHRIELGEIGAALRQHEAVRDAAVCVLKDPGGVQRLVGYVIPREGTTSPSGGELAEYLRGRVPSYMVVNSYVFLDELPLTANGKVDRKRLPVPDFSDADSRDGGVPATPLQEKVASLWSEVLKEGRPGLRDNFFEMGGDSLLAIRLAQKIRDQFGVNFGVDAVLASPTVEGLAGRVENLLSASEEAAMAGEEIPALELHPGEAFEPFPLTSVQQAYLIGRSGAYELGGAASRYYCEIDSRNFDSRRFTAVWNKLVARHPMMRAVITGDGRQRVLESVPDYMPVVRDLSSLKNRDEELERLRRELPQVPLPLSGWPLFSVSFSLLGEGMTRIHFVFDNIMYDGRSVYLLLDEAARLYADPRLTLRPLEATYRDYILGCEKIQDSAPARRDRGYWMERLGEISPAPVFPLAVDPSMLKDNTFVRRSLVLNKEEARRLQSECAARGLTLSGALLSAYAEVLSRWSSSPQFTVNLTLFNRVPFSPEVAKLVGDFTALTLLSVDMAQGATFAERAKGIQKRLWSDLAHPYMGGMEVMRELTAQGRSARMPVVFTSGLGIEAGSAGDALGTVQYAVTQTPQVWLDNQVSRQNGNLVLAWDAVEALFPAGMLDSMFRSYSGLVQKLCGGQGWDEARPERVGSEEICARANSTEAPLPQGTLLSAFRETLERTPEAPAVITEERTLSYGELAGRAMSLASRLERLNPGPMTAIVMEKGWEQAVAELAVLLAGSGWIPVEADAPLGRMKAIFEEAGVRVVLTQEHLARSLRWPDATLLTLDSGDSWEQADPKAFDGLVMPEDAAYVIYTSGSTGRPKGVTISHAAVLNTLADINGRFHVGPSDRTFGLSRYSFDLSVYDFWGAFQAGAACVIPPRDAGRDPSRWIGLIEKNSVTIWNSVPALMQMFADWLAASGRDFPQSLRTIMLSGDWIPLGLPDQLKKQGCKASLYSLGGATEASIWSIFYPVDRVDPSWQSIPYGRPLGNQRFYVLDGAGCERPVGVPGDLCIAGAGLSSGYWNNPERTREAFVNLPSTGEPVYRTGDLGWRRADGDLVFTGRSDFQVKLRGFRIELGEIEHVARATGAVREAVVLLAGSSDADRRLVIIVSAPGSAADDKNLKETLDRAFRENLPEYMVPSVFLRRDDMPLSANGKVDRRALQAMADSATSKSAAEAGARKVAAETGMEKAVSGIWEELLGRTGIGCTENFFEAGGTSVLAMKLYQKLLPLAGKEFPLVWIFEYPTIRALAGALEKNGERPGSGKAPEAGGAAGRRGERRRRAAGRRKAGR